MQVTEEERARGSLLRPPLYWLFHSFRLFGWLGIVPPLLWRRYTRKATLLTLLTYIAIHRQRWWQNFVHRTLSMGASRRHRVDFAGNKHLLDPSKRYLFALHPHSILMDGWHSIIARQAASFDSATGPCGIGRRIALCFAPVIQHVPVHQEMYREMCSDATRRTIEKWWDESDADPALAPGGFAESVFSDAGERRKEYSYIKDRKGFVRICVERGIDIAPVYTFRATRMYFNLPWLRGLRARLSQQIFVGIVWPMGWLGTAMPLTDRTTTVLFPPFAASSFAADQVDAAHAAYLRHLQKHFDEYKGAPPRTAHAASHLEA